MINCIKEKKIKKITKKIAITGFVVLALTIGWVILDGEYQLNYIHLQSSLRDVLHHNSEKEYIRQEILNLIPVGTSIEDSKKTLAKHFKGDFDRKPDLPNINKKIGGFNYLCVRIFEKGHVISGSNWVEAVLIFDSDNTLREILVEYYGAWL